MATDRLLWSLLIALSTLFPLAALGQQGTISAEIVSKRYSSGYFPTVGGYVEYEVRLTNTGYVALENQPLEVLLASDGNRTHSYATYAVALEPGASKTLYLGPFKIEEEGMHRLFVEMDGVTGYEPDSFTVYRQEAVQAALVAIPLIAAGAGLVGFSLYRRRKAV